MSDLRKLLRLEGRYIVRRGYVFLGWDGFCYSGDLERVQVIDSLNQARLAALFNAPCEVWRSWGSKDQQLILVCQDGFSGVQWVADL